MTINNSVSNDFYLRSSIVLMFSIAIDLVWFPTVQRDKFRLLIIPFAKIVSEYDQEIPQSQTTDKHMAPRGRATIDQQTSGRQTKQSNSLSCYDQDDYKTRMDIKKRTTKKEQLQNLAIGVTINNESTTTAPPP